MTDTGPPEGDIDPREEAAAAVLWDESRRQITRQEAGLDSLRTRAVALLSVSSLVAGLFGGRFANIRSHEGYAKLAIVVALVTFTLSVVAVIVILTPKKKGWVFAQDLDQYFPLLSKGRLVPFDVTRNLAKHFEQSRKANAGPLEWRYCWFTAACVFTGLEVVAWGISII